MSDLMQRAHRMALPDPHDERPDPNWMVLMRELIERIEELERVIEAVKIAAYEEFAEPEDREDALIRALSSTASSGGQE